MYMGIEMRHEVDCGSTHCTLHCTYARKSSWLRQAVAVGAVVAVAIGVGRRDTGTSSAIQRHDFRCVSQQTTTRFKDMHGLIESIAMMVQPPLP